MLMKLKMEDVVLAKLNTSPAAVALNAPSVRLTCELVSSMKVGKPFVVSVF